MKNSRIKKYANTSHLKSVTAGLKIGFSMITEKLSTFSG